MIRCVLVASVVLHVAVFAALPASPRAIARAPLSSSLVELANEPPKEEPPPPPPTPAETAAPAPAPFVERNVAPARRPTAAPANDAPATATSNDVGGSAVDGDGPADFTSTVLSNAAPGPASKIVVTAPAAPSAAPPSEPKLVPASSLSRRPGAPGLDAELERNYPIDARRAGISGSARLRVRILADGRVGKVERVSESHPGFGDACTKTVRAARWEPPLDADGRAVATEIVYVCKFEVRS